MYYATYTHVFGRNSGWDFDDFDDLFVYPDAPLNPNKAKLIELRVMYRFDVSMIEGISLIYLKDDGVYATKPHGTSELGTDNYHLARATTELNGSEKIIAITGRHGQTSGYGIRVTDLSFHIYDTSKKTTRIFGPFGSGHVGTPFQVAANGSFVACAGFADNSDKNLWQLKQEGHDGDYGGLQGLRFVDIAYRKA